eukprot:SAG31_NODE_297_length_18175_cov_68.266659_6_plen_255_part_00
MLTQARLLETRQHPEGEWEYLTHWPRTRPRWHTEAYLRERGLPQRLLTHLTQLQNDDRAARAKRASDRKAGLKSPSHTKHDTAGAGGARTMPSRRPALTQTTLTDPRARATKRQKLPSAQRPDETLLVSTAQTGQQPTDKVVQQQRLLDRVWAQLWPELQLQVLYERDDAARPETLAQYRDALDVIHKHTERFTPEFLATLELAMQYATDGCPDLEAHSCPEGTEDAVRVERDGTRSKFEGMPHTVVFVLLITI